MPGTRIVLHIGMPNAGSSAVQYGLWRYRDELRARGVHYYMGAKTPRFVSSGNGKDLAAFLNPRRRGPGFSEAVFERTFAERFLSSAHPVSIISAEQLAGAAAEPLETLRRELIGAYEVQVVGFIRDLYGHARSSWMQQIKRQAYVEGFAHYVRKSYGDMQCGAALRFGRVFGFGNVSLIHLESLKEDMFEAFLRAVGIPGGFGPLPRVNRGLSPAEVGALRLCNRIHRSTEWATCISDRLLEARAEGPRAPVWSAGLAAEIEARHRGRIDRVNLRFFANAPVLQVAREPQASAKAREDVLRVWGAIMALLAREAWRRVWTRCGLMLRRLDRRPRVV